MFCFFLLSFCKKKKKEDVSLYGIQNWLSPKHSHIHTQSAWNSSHEEQEEVHSAKVSGSSSQWEECCCSARSTNGEEMKKKNNCLGRKSQTGSIELVKRVDSSLMAPFFWSCKGANRGLICFSWVLNYSSRKNKEAWDEQNICKCFGEWFFFSQNFLSALNCLINHPQQLAEQSRTSRLGITGLDQPTSGAETEAGQRLISRRLINK